MRSNVRDTLAWGISDVRSNVRDTGAWGTLDVRSNVRDTLDTGLRRPETLNTAFPPRESAGEGREGGAEGVEVYTCVLWMDA